MIPTAAWKSQRKNGAGFSTVPTAPTTMTCDQDPTGNKHNISCTPIAIWEGYSAAGAGSSADRSGSSAICKSSSADSTGSVANRESDAADRLGSSANRACSSADASVNWSSILVNYSSPFDGSVKNFV
jgi:hypothetical protein